MVPADAQQDRFGQAELHDADQDEKEVDRKRGEHHRQADFQTRGQNGDEEIAPELQRVRPTGNATNCAASPKGSGGKDQRDI